jgi:hypothetical protein
MQSFKWIKCHCCGRQLALTNDRRIILGSGGYCDEPVPLKCQGCGARRYWKPLKVVDVLDQKEYTEFVPA